MESTAPLKLMTHLVAGYPNISTNIELATAMEKAGADFIEIQIPFTDPMADGPTIMRANQASLDQNTKLEDCFKLMEQLSKTIHIPLLFMTYGNIPYRMGMEKFIKQAKQSGASGLIIPDLPYDEEINNYNELCRKNDLWNIQVISPDTEMNRIDAIKKYANGFIYITLKVGITGTSGQLDPKALAFIKKVKKIIHLPLAAGFGLSKPSQMNQLKGLVDIAVIGSKVIEIEEAEGVSGVSEFLKQLKQA